jgi:nucleoid-associated protein YgaU
MTKETKIGLSVIGVLLTVFGGLVVRKLAYSEVVDGPVAEAPPPAVRSASAAEKPQVIPQRNPGAGVGQTAWAKNGIRGESADEGDVPHPVYMPSAAERLRQRGADEVDQRDDVTPAAHANPFQRPVAERTPGVEDEIPDAASQPPARLRESAADPQALRVSEPRSTQSRLNPIRRASAEEPIGEPTLDANEAPPIDNGQGADLTPASPTMTLAPADDRAVETPSDDERPASLGAPLVEPPADDPQPAQQTQWQAGDTTDRAAAGVEPVMPDNGKYTVQPNDSLWTVSEKVYGSGRYFKAIYEHNRSRLPRADKLAVGTIILVPPVATLEQNYPALCPKQRKSAMVKPRTLPASTRQRGVTGDNVYVVAEGDTLFDIARYELGKASRWAEIYQLNRDALGEDFDYLQPGTELVMPAKSPATDSFTRQRDSRIQR